MGEPFRMTFDMDNTISIHDYMKANDAEARGRQWLADGNAAVERGNKKRAEYCYRKAQYWLDRYDRFMGNNQ